MFDNIWLWSCINLRRIRFLCNFCVCINRTLIGSLLEAFFLKIILVAQLSCINILSIYLLILTLFCLLKTIFFLCSIFQLHIITLFVNFTCCSIICWLDLGCFWSLVGLQWWRFGRCLCCGFWLAICNFGHFFSLINCFCWVFWLIGFNIFHFIFISRVFCWAVFRWNLVFRLRLDGLRVVLLW